MRRIGIICLIFIVLAAMSCGSRGGVVVHDDPVPAPGFVGIADGHFVVDGEPWFPVMLNYKAEMRMVDGEVQVVPAPWYTDGPMRRHFDTIASWGFNAVRICLDADYSDFDTAAMHRAVHRAVLQADSAGLRVMLLVQPPLDAFWMEYTEGLLRYMADVPALWAYDLMNEPLYFDPEPRREKQSADSIVREWRKMVRRNAPHQLFTVGLAEPIEVFEWDPSTIPVDFVEMHTYHPLRVQSEMWWYSHYCGKPWMVGETGLPADGDSVTYEAQQSCMWETYRFASLLGACGYGWWEFQDCPKGVNFEAQYTGLRDSTGQAKPAARMLKCICFGVDDWMPTLPVNYYNMLAYRNVAVVGRVVSRIGRPIEGAVVRGWNNDWSIGVNTFSDADGRFRLVSNDTCTHFEISAPGMTNAKFDRRPGYPAGIELKECSREYHQIPVTGWGDDRFILPYNDRARYAAESAMEVNMGDVVLDKMVKWNESRTNKCPFFVLGLMA